MITLASDCLLFEMANGESVPFSADMISVEVTGEGSGQFDPHFIQHAANAVFHYFKNDLGRMTITVGEFACLLEKVLRGFGFMAGSVETDPGRTPAPHADLRQIAKESAPGFELFFFPRLRDELRHQLRRAPGMVRFHGLRSCVKQLAGARRWSARCESLRDRIVEYLRECLSAEQREGECALLVD